MKKLPCRANRAHIGLLGFVLTVASVAHASVYTVDTVGDLVDDDVTDGLCHTVDDTCSLRAAIMQANHSSDPDPTLIHVPPGTYVLTLGPGGVAGEDDGEDKGDLNLTAAAPLIEILGAGAPDTIVDGNQLDGVMTIDAGRAASISGVTIRNGNRRFGGHQNGGGIDNRGTLTITDSIVEGNRVESGCCRGGGIASSGVLNVVRTILQSNTAYQGGGLFSVGHAFVFGSTFRDNTASFGGALYHFGSAPDNDLHIANTTISHNHARSNGGGIINSGNLVLVNSTLSNNDAANDGGGLFNLANAFLYNVSIVANDSDSDHDENGGIGGGVYVYPGERLVAVNSLIASNTVTGFTDNDCNGTVEVYGWNLFGDVGGCLFSGNGISSRGAVSIGTIGPLLENGGPTVTHALLEGSEAIDTTTSQGCIDETGAPLATDQRGAARVAGPRCDVGAFEYGAVVPVDDGIFVDGFEPTPVR